MTQIETERCGGRIIGGYCEACGARPEATVCKHPKKCRTILEAAALALLEKLAEMEKPIDAVCVISGLRGQPYSGPTWTEERDALAAVLAGTESDEPTQLEAASRAVWDNATNGESRRIRREAGLHNSDWYLVHREHLDALADALPEETP